MWVLFLFVCERARVSVVWSPLGWGVVFCATAPVSWYFSVAQENDNCQPLVPAGFVGSLSAPLPVFVLLLFQLAGSPHRLESPWGCQCLGFFPIAETFGSIACCVRLRKRSVLFVKSFASARCRELLVCPFTCEACPCCLS